MLTWLPTVRRLVTGSRIENQVLSAGSWVVFALFANAFAAWFVSKEQYIYFWGLADYWHDTSLMVYMLRRAPLGAVSKLLYSIRHFNYNYLPTVPLVVPMLIFGQTRLVYILSIVNIYAIPAAYALTSASKAIAKTEGLLHAEWLCLLAPVVALTLPTFWVPTLRGYPDVGGLVFIGLILLSYFRKRPQALEVGESLSCGVLLALLVLFRRWYAFWAASFIMLLPLDATFDLWNDEGLNFRIWWKTYRPMILIAFSSGIVLVGIAWPLVVRMITTPYRDICSAYRGSAGLLDSLSYTGRFYFGAFVCIAFAVSVIIMAASQNLRRISAFLVAQLILMIVFFERIQGFSWHHLYLLMPAIVILLSFSLLVIANMTSWFALPVYSLFSIMAFVPVFSTYTGPLDHFSQNISSIGKCPPLIRHDLPEMRRLLAVLEAYCSRARGTVYVLASSQVINSTLLWDANLSLNTNYQVTGRIVRTAEVDRRDGFPLQLLNADYVVVALPIQYHLRPEDQRMVALPTQALMMRQNIGNAFEQLSESFVLDDDVKVYLFRKVRPVTKVELGGLIEECKRVYPDQPEICIPPR